MEKIQENIREEFAIVQRNRELEKLIYKSRVEINSNKEKIRKLRQHNFSLMNLKST